MRSIACLALACVVAVAFSAPMSIPEDDFDYGVAYETELVQAQDSSGNPAQDTLSGLERTQSNAERSLKAEEDQMSEVKKAAAMLASGKTGHFELKIPEFAVGELRKAEEKTVKEDLMEVQGHSTADMACACCHQAGKKECYSTKCSDGTGDFCWSTSESGIHWGWGGEGKKGYNNGAAECTKAQMWGKCVKQHARSKKASKAAAVVRAAKAAKDKRVKAIVRTVARDEKKVEAAAPPPAAPKKKAPAAPKKAPKKKAQSIDHKYAARQKKAEAKIISRAEHAAKKAKELVFIDQDFMYRDD